MSTNVNKPTRSSIARRKHSTANEEGDDRRTPRTPMQLIAEDDSSWDEGTIGEARQRGVKERSSASARAGRAGIDPTVLAFAEWLSDLRSSSQEDERATGAAMRQCGREAKIQRNAVDLLRRDLNTLSSTWQQQFEAAFKALEVASKDITTLKKSRNKFEDSVRQEMASLVGILSGMNREIKMLREERHEEAASVSKQVDQLRTELADLRQDLHEHCKGCEGKGGRQSQQVGGGGNSDNAPTRERAESPFKKALPVQRSERFPSPLDSNTPRTSRTNPNTPRATRTSSAPWGLAAPLDTTGSYTARMGSSWVPSYTIAAPANNSIDLTSFDGNERAKLVSMNHRPADVVYPSSRYTSAHTTTPYTQTGSPYVRVDVALNRPSSQA